MSATPVVSVVVPNWNGRPFLVRCLAALRRQTLPPADVVIVDGGSSDGSLESVRADFPDVRLVALDRNVGFAAAANAGAQAAAGEHVAFLNNDAEPEPAWLEELVACLERHPKAASVACRCLQLEDARRLDGAGDSMTWSLKAYRRGAGEPDGPRYAVEEEVFSASGTACLWRASVFAELGGFDEDFFAYYEDIDLGFRARLAGHECWYAPRAVVRHVGAASASADSARFHTSLSVRNRWATVVKNAPARWLAQHAPVIVVGEALWLGRSLLRGDLGAHLQAYATLVHELRFWRAKRRAVQAFGEGWGVGLERLRAPRLPPRSAIRTRALTRGGIQDARERIEHHRSRARSAVPVDESRAAGRTKPMWRAQ